MIGKFNKHNFVQAYHSAKNYIGNAYHTTKNVLGNIDNAVSAGKSVYVILAPYIDEFSGGKGIHKNAMKAITAYDDIRNQVVDKHDNVLTKFNDINHKLSKKNIML